MMEMMVVVAVLSGICIIVAGALKLPVGWSIVMGMIGPPALLVGFALAAAMWEAVMAPIRIRHAMERIAELDRSEAPDDEYAELFRHFEWATIGVAPDRYLPQVRVAMRDERAKSRGWFLSLLGRRREIEPVRELVMEIAEDWSDPLSPRAQRMLG